MPVIVDSARPVGGVYQAVREQIEGHARLHAERMAGWHADFADHPYPMQRILDALRAGQPIDVPLWAVPEHALQGLAKPADPGFRRAVVHPGDVVEIVADSGAGWLEDNGL